MPTSVTVRMYNQLNLGDCFLLKFIDGDTTVFLLVDFGSYERGNEMREREIAQNIIETVGDNPITIVLTHQHKDHLSGFISAFDILHDHFKDKKVSLWLSYLDDPIGEEAVAMRAATEKFWNKNKQAKEAARKRFANAREVSRMLDAKDAFDLFAEDQQGGEAITNLLKLAKHREQFLLPGKWFQLPEMPKNTVKVYVLGPPTDKSLLTKLNPGKDEAVENLNTMTQLVNLDSAAGLMLDTVQAMGIQATSHSASADEDFPFSKKFICRSVNTDLKSSYLDKSKGWRRIDYDWLTEMGRLSLHMDTLTNNSSLVLAFELVESGKVLLFVGDAQIGNWKSWFDVKFKKTDVTARELLSRTVLYKAGHHSSHNATLLESLNLMNEDELVIMIPVNERVSTNRGFAMLKPGMLRGYNRKSDGRVVRSDTIYHKPTSANGFKFPFAKTEKDFTPAISIGKSGNSSDHLFIEYTVQ